MQLSKNTKTDRSIYIDVVKAFSIILVVIGHNIQFGCGEFFLSEQLFYDSRLYQVIYSFHMPLFTIISGYLFYYTAKKYPVKRIIINKTRGLLLPVISWSSIPVSIILAKVGINGNIGWDLIPLILSTVYHNLWFLWAILFCVLVTLVVKYICKDSTIVYGVLVVLFLITPDFYNFHLYKYVYPYFVVGYFGAKVGIKDRIKNHQKMESIVVCVLVLSYLTLIQFFSKETFIYTTKISILNRGGDTFRQINIDMYRYIIGFIGVGAVLLLLMDLCRHIRENSVIEKVLCYIGRNSMGIYIIDSILVQYLLHRICKRFNGFNILCILIESVLIIIIALGCSEIIRRCRILSLFLFGESK